MKTKTESQNQELSKLKDSSNENISKNNTFEFKNNFKRVNPFIYAEETTFMAM